MVSPMSRSPAPYRTVSLNRRLLDQQRADQGLHFRNHLCKAPGQQANWRAAEDQGRDG
jgi:hypothetical protein